MAAGTGKAGTSAPRAAAADATACEPQAADGVSLTGLLSPSGDLLVGLLDVAKPMEAQEVCAAFAEECNRSACQFLASGNPARSLKQLMRAHRVLDLDWVWSDAAMHQRLLALTLNNMACERQHRGEHADAQRYLQEAVQIERRLEDGCPGTVPKPAETLCNLAVVMSKVGKHHDAIGLIRSAISLLEKLREARDERGGLESLNTVAAAQYNLGAEYEHLRSWDQALEAYRDCLSTVRQLATARKSEGASAGAGGQASLDMAERAMTAVMDLQRRVESEARLRQTMHFSKATKSRGRRSRSTGMAHSHSLTLSMVSPGQEDEARLYSDKSMAIDHLPGGRSVAALARVSGDVRRLMSDGMHARISQSRLRVGRRRPATTLPSLRREGRHASDGERPRRSLRGGFADPMLDRMPGHQLTRAQEAWGPLGTPGGASKPRLAPLARSPPSTAPAVPGIRAWGFITVPSGQRPESSRKEVDEGQNFAAADTAQPGGRRKVVQPPTHQPSVPSSLGSQKALAGLSPASIPSPVASLWSPEPTRAAEPSPLWESDPRASPGARSVTWADDSGQPSGSPAWPTTPASAATPTFRIDESRSLATGASRGGVLVHQAEAGHPPATRVTMGVNSTPAAGDSKASSDAYRQSKDRLTRHINAALGSPARRGGLRPHSQGPTVLTGGLSPGVGGGSESTERAHLSMAWSTPVAARSMRQ